MHNKLRRYGRRHNTPQTTLVARYFVACALRTGLDPQTKTSILGQKYSPDKNHAFNKSLTRRDTAMALRGREDRLNPYPTSTLPSRLSSIIMCIQVFLVLWLLHRQARHRHIDQTTDHTAAQCTMKPVPRNGMPLVTYTNSQNAVPFSDF